MFFAGTEEVEEDYADARNEAKNSKNSNLH